MGVYSQYNTSSGDVVAANEAYEGTIGAYQMIEESEINSYNIFESIIGRDFAETTNALDESVITESEMTAINEASVEGIWAKVVAFIKKVWEKIKGVLNSIKTKIQSVFIKDGKELYNKYKKTINNKINNGKLSDFKFKWKELKTDNVSGSSITDATFGARLKILLESSKVRDDMVYNLKIAKSIKGYHDKDNSNPYKVYKRSSVSGSVDADTKSSPDIINPSKKGEDIAKVNDTTEDKGMKNVRPYTPDESTDMLEETLGALCGSSSAVSAKEFAKEFHDNIFEEEEEKDNISKYIGEIESTLQNTKLIKGIEDAEKETDRDFKAKRKEAEEVQKQMQKANSDKATQSTFAAASNRLAGRTTTCLNIISKASGMLFGAATSCTKEYIKQCRSVWIKAAAYNQKKAPYEEATLLEAMADVSDYEVDEMFSVI